MVRACELRVTRLHFIKQSHSVSDPSLQTRALLIKSSLHSMYHSAPRPSAPNSPFNLTPESEVSALHRLRQLPVCRCGHFPVQHRRESAFISLGSTLVRRRAESDDPPSKLHQDGLQSVVVLPRSEHGNLGGVDLFHRPPLALLPPSPPSPALVPR